jgi:hypothetical protein
MRNSRLFGVALLILFSASCGQDNVTGVGHGAIEPSLNATSGGVKKRFDFAAGAVEVDAFGLNHKYSFTAVGEPGTTAGGAWTWSGRHPDATWHASGRVICMTVIDNVAHISGIVEETDAYWIQPPFNYAVWTVVDMGNKKKSPPDLASLFGVATTETRARAHCVSGTFQYTPPVTRGEVVVRMAKLKQGQVSDDDETDD